MRRHTSCIVLTVLTCFLSGCLQNFKSRNCTAFNHPVAKQWQPIEAGNSIVFSNAAGDSAVHLLSVTSSEPYVASVDVNSSALDSPVCEMTSTQVFSAEDGSHEITLNFRQRENDFLSSTGNSLGLIVEVSLPSAESGEPRLVLSRTQSENLINPSSVVDDYSVQPHLIASKVLENGQTYSDVIVFPNVSIPPEPEFEQYLLSELLLSRNVGLIQLSRDNGNVFTVVPE